MSAKAACCSDTQSKLCMVELGSCWLMPHTVSLCRQVWAPWQSQQQPEYQAEGACSFCLPACWFFRLRSFRTLVSCSGESLASSSDRPAARRSSSVRPRRNLAAWLGLGTAGLCSGGPAIHQHRSSRPADSHEKQPTGVGSHL